MEVHKAKPVHSWGELASEIGIIVIGVLIALGAEQIVENLHWRHQVGQHRAALKQELATNGVYFYERLAVYDCLHARLLALDAALARSGDEWKAGAPLAGGPAKAVYRPPWRYFPSQAWQNAMTSGVVSHMPRELTSTYETVYIEINDIHQLNLQEQLAAEQLGDLDHDLRFTDVSRDRYQRSVAELKFHARAAASIAGESLALLRAANLSPPASDLQDMLASDRRAYGTCVTTPKV